MHPVGRRRLVLTAPALPARTSAPLSVHGRRRRQQRLAFNDLVELAAVEPDPATLGPLPDAPRRFCTLPRSLVLP